ncbi:MAG: TetR/AcrR family transcriptional regulator [Myxococcaceae bacterium]|nr:TetR/AcrR family transcriptional regulator [Myxococcaceae bacterium]
MARRLPQPERRAQIADAALRIIETRGIGQLTVAALAEEVGMTGGALYRHYASLEAVLEAVAERVSELLDESLPDPSLAPLDWLERFIKSRSTAVSGHPGLARLLFSDQFALAMPQASIARLREAILKTFGGIAAALERGQEQGVIRRDLAPLALVPAVAGIVQVLVLAQGGRVLEGMMSADVAWPILRALLMPPKEGAA